MLNLNHMLQMLKKVKVYRLVPFASMVIQGFSCFVSGNVGCVMQCDRP